MRASFRSKCDELLTSLSILDQPVPGEAPQQPEAGAGVGAEGEGKKRKKKKKKGGGGGGGEG